VSFVAFGCSHAPLQCDDAISVICERIRELAPDRVVHLGDLHEADSASRWPSEYGWTLQDEFAAANEKVLKRVRVANPNPDAAYVFLPGNHDDNLLAIDRIPKNIRGACDYNIPQYSQGVGKAPPVWLNEEFLTHWRTMAKYRYNRVDGTYRIGAVNFSHGYECGASSDEFQSITLGWPMGLFISAHTHRPSPGEPKQSMRTKTLPLPYWYLNAGCTRDMECSFMERKRQQMWGIAMVYGWAMPISSPRFSRTWDAYCELIKPYEIFQ